MIYSDNLCVVRINIYLLVNKVNSSFKFFKRDGCFRRKEEGNKYLIIYFKLTICNKQTKICKKS